MKLLVLEGPNLNLLGFREPEIYGTQTAHALHENMRQYALTNYPEVHLDFLQTNHEGALIDALHDARITCDAVLFNPGAYTHYAWALRDAVVAIDIPVIEVHLSDPCTREEFRHVNVLEGACMNRFAGKGQSSYFEALDFVCDRFRSLSARKRAMRR